MPTLASAADLWRTWANLGVLRPRDYDTDVLEALGPLVGAPADLSADTIPGLFDTHGISARDFIRALTPLITSFAGMLRDLLALYARVGATHGTGDNLRIEYEFEDGHVVDDSLASFREAVTSVEQATVTLPQLVFDGNRAWDPVWRPYGRVDHDLSRTLGEVVDQVVWLDTVPPPSPTGRPDVDDVVTRWWHLIGECRRLIAEIADDHGQMLAWLYADNGVAPAAQVDLVRSATDYWPASQIEAVHGLAIMTSRGAAPSATDLAALDEWLAAFWQDRPTSAAVEALTDVLSLPLWGRRHELYSAWILTQLDAALPGRLTIEVVDGAIRFPFAPTRLATLEVAGDDGGSRPVDLWSEFRSPADDLAGSGRKHAVQPDYQFRVADAGSDARGALLAVEVKQYLRSVLRNPGLALRDYALALPSAQVVLVAHGPLSPRVTTLTPHPAADRVAAFPHVRPTLPSRYAPFRTAVASCLPAPPLPPPPPAPPQSQGSETTAPVAAQPFVAAPEGLRLTLRWHPWVHDLDLSAHRSGIWERVSYASAVQPWGRLRADAFDGGPEVLDVRPTGDAIRLTVRVYKGADSVEEAGAVLEVTTADATVYLRPARGVGREWRVGELAPDGTFLPSTATVAPE
ncbi:hypothetical protein SAMN05216184_11275 [Georgenia satyanarayanai]|uniref:Uncharacterized protein n=1 Tax=Georgenia satyanarayanai TaxID=860221 RepID=A0A2Y9AMH1_9MICO|nr:hypothetical protein [Georgenia satyanarayanai]PYF98331.1 hypothetical protein A8987_11275 [Georgenia satyanarayanai]SSA45216.1 hypothetical protein SAMN05216184_11275 [Georgenia satyanarayanai]